MKKIIFLITKITLISFMSCQQCEEIVYEPCGGSQEKPMIDLVIIMDQSNSMSSAAIAVSNAVEQGFQNALDTCPSDLRKIYLGLDGNPWASTTIFDMTHRYYLDSILMGAITSGDVVLNADITSGIELNEKGSSGVIDLANHFDWREGACRAIFYISDEELDSNSPTGDYTNEDIITQQAIEIANEQNVTVFLHFIDHQNRPAQIKQNYTDLAEQTGGSLFYTTDQNVPSELYVSILPEIVCNSCNACSLNDMIK